MRTTALSLIALLFLNTASFASDHPSRRHGFGLSSSFLSNELDSVNLFNGNLILRVPVSQVYRVGGSLSYQLVLYYNSNLWNYEENSVTPWVGQLLGDPRCVGCDTNNAGAGWRLSPFGHRFFAFQAPNDTGLPMLMEPDGTRRLFYPTLHDGETFDCVSPPGAAEPSCDHGYYYTRDGSYLRAEIEFVPGLGTLTTIESPDGTKRHFDEFGYPVRVEDLPGNYIDITRRNYNGGGGAQQCQTSLKPQSQQCWKIADSTGRTIIVHFRPAGPTVTEKQVDSIEVATFGGLRSTVQFDYQELETTDLNNPNGPDIVLPFLTKLTFAPEESGGLADYEFEYYPTNLLGQGEYSGAMKRVTLPTQGVYEWVYGQWGATGCAGLAALQTVEGVIEKRIFDSPAAADAYDPNAPLTFIHLAGKWIYKHDPNVGSGVLGDTLIANTRRTLVTSPAGDQSLYYFSSEDQTGGSGCELSMWWNGLSFTLDGNRDISVTSPTQTLYRSHELYDGSVSANNLVRTNYLRYTADEGADETKGNHRLLRDRTYFDDDPDAQGVVPHRGTKRSNFDGLGHFRTVETESDFTWGSNLPDEKTIFTRLNPEGCISGSQPVDCRYDIDIEESATPTGPFTPPPTTSPWLITDFNERKVTEGGDTSTQLFCFNQGTGGFLEGIRTLATNSAAGSQAGRDLLERRTPDGNGNIKTQAFYGGDGGQLSTSLGCSAASGLLDYTVEHQWQHGVLKDTDYKNGAAVVLHAVTRTIDDNTGLVETEKDVSGLKTTTYTYDRLSRITQIARTDLATTSVSYFPASGSQPARIEVTEDGPTLLAKSATEFDPFGRVQIEESTRSSGAPAKRRFCYDAQGRLTKRGEWGAGTTCPSGSPKKWTNFFNYDRFNRPGLIVPPDGDEHQIELTWAGQRKLTRTVRSATSAGSGCNPSASDETCASTIEVYDGLGRLARVLEPNGLTAVYTYDEGDRLREARLNPGGQTRDFLYDGRGFLQCEKHPETGSTDYKYDALGNLTQRFQVSACGGTTPIGFDLSFTYDKAERLTTVKETGGNILKTFVYDPSNSRGASKGNLKTATRHNRVDLGSGIQDVQVFEDYYYQASGGAVSQRRTRVSGSGFDLRWRLDQNVNKLGDLATLKYPCFANSSFMCLETQRQVNLVYSNGWLTSITSGTAGISHYVTGVLYHGNGMLNQVTYGDGSLYAQTPDTDLMQRPAGMSFQGTTFSYAYDGSGNIKAATEGGTTTTYRYDTRNRLLSMSEGSTALQAYEYDNYGNLKKITTGTTVRNVNVSSATNQLTDGNGNICPPGGGPCYDSAGNMTISPAGVLLEYDSLSMGTNNGASNDTYFYTADDERIGTVRSDGSATWRLRGLDGLVLGEYESDAPGACHAATTVTGNIGATDPQCYESSTSLSSTATILSGADVSFRAQDSVILQGGFKVSLGAQFRAGPRGIGGGDTFWTRDYVHGLGYLLATNASSSEARRYIGPDWLGTPRIVKTSSGDLDNVLLGFGEEDSTAYPASDLPLLFTGHERDRNGNAGVDLDYMHARYYWPLYGRFTSPDPVGGNPRAPQSWNRYAYVMNNPIKYVDPYGLWPNPGSIFAIGLNDELCALLPTCIPLGGDGPPPGSTLFTGPFYSADSNLFANSGFSLFGDLQVTLDPAIARRVLTGFTESGGVVATAYGLLGLGFLDLYGLHSQRDVGMELALAAIPGPGKGKLIRSALKLANAKKLGGPSLKRFLSRIGAGSAESFKAEWVGAGNVSRYNISHLDGQIVLTPVRRGGGEVIPTGIPYP